MKKIFVTVLESSEEPRKRDGRTEIDLLVKEHRFAADSIKDVWEAAQKLCESSGEELVAVYEEHPAITIL